MTILHAAASLAQVAAATSAGALVRGRHEHRPVAYALAAVTVANLLRAARLLWLVPAVRLATDPPYTGWTRVVFHVDEALWLVWPAALAWVAWRVFGVYHAINSEHSASARLLNPHPSEMPPTPSSARGLRLFAASWLFVSAALVLAYPAMRGGALRRVYLGTELAAVAVALAAVVAWLRRGAWRAAGCVTTTELCGLLMVALTAVDLFVGGWRHGLFGDAYAPSQALDVILYGSLIVVQVAALAINGRAP